MSLLPLSSLFIIFLSLFLSSIPEFLKASDYSHLCRSLSLFSLVSICTSLLPFSSLFIIFPSHLFPWCFWLFTLFTLFISLVFSLYSVSMSISFLVTPVPLTLRSCPREARSARGTTTFPPPSGGTDATSSVTSRRWWTPTTRVDPWQAPHTPQTKLSLWLWPGEPRGVNSCLVEWCCGLLHGVSGRGSVGVSSVDLVWCRVRDLSIGHRVKGRGHTSPCVPGHTSWLVFYLVLSVIGKR